jgi:hypothetical protein
MLSLVSPSAALGPSLAGGDCTQREGSQEADFFYAADGLAGPLRQRPEDLT